MRKPDTEKTLRLAFITFGRQCLTLFFSFLFNVEAPFSYCLHYITLHTQTHTHTHKQMCRALGKFRSIVVMRDGAGD